MGLYAGVASRVALREPVAVAAAPVDAWIPLLAPTALPYLSYGLLVPCLVIWTRRRPELPALFLTAACCVLVTQALNVLVPTRLASPPAAPPGTLLAWVRALDGPLAAAPSGHVSLPVCLAVAAGLLGSPVARRFALWAALLAVCTLTTKQHYAFDVVSGALLGAWVALWATPLLARGTVRGVGLHPPTAVAMAGELALAAVALAFGAVLWTPWAVAVSLVAVARAQHALFMLYHDAVHGLLARDPRWNDALVNLFVGVPQLLPVHLYRALHLAHHRRLGTPGDPERVLLYSGQPWRYQPLPARGLARQLAGDLLGWNTVAMLLRYTREGRSARSPLRLPRVRVYPELWGMAALWLAAAALLAWTAPQTAVRLAVLWLVPLLTLTQLLQKLRSFAEHRDEASPSLSLSWEPGLLGRLFVWPYHIHLHREHHEQPGVPWDELPALAPGGERLPGRAQLRHVWNGSL